MRHSTPPLGQRLAAMAVAVLIGAVTAGPPWIDAMAAGTHVKHRLKTKSAAKAERPAAARILNRTEVLAADPAALERLGRHIIVGFETFKSVGTLVERKAITGIFITDHNVRRRSVAEIRSEIDALQAMRVRQGLPPLIVAADQEGGAVSRLSPPLKRQQGLKDVIDKFAANAVERRAAVEAYARVQARELQRIGVTLNFAPVVDLNIDPKRRSDGQTQLRHRALSPNPEIVAEAAGWYCDTLAAEGIMCTTKHFPGLGRVARDTHRATGDVATEEVELSGADWIPFRRMMEKPGVITMLAHVRLKSLDAETPVSYSKRVISGTIRNKWNYNGVLITDDLSMGAITRGKDGLGGSAVKALNAGADLILVSFSDRDLNTVMTRLLDADRTGELESGRREESARRLTRSIHQSFTVPQ